MPSMAEKLKEQRPESGELANTPMTLENLVSNLDGKVKVEDSTASKIIRETLLKIRQEVSSVGVEGRIAIPFMGVFVVRGGPGEANRILFHPAQDKPPAAGG